MIKNMQTERERSKRDDEDPILVYTQPWTITNPEF